MGQAEGRTDCHSDKKCLCDVEHRGNVRGIIIQFPFKYTCNFGQLKSTLQPITLLSGISSALIFVFSLLCCF